MTFWSGETIRQRLSTLIKPFDDKCIEGASYAMKVGAEYYISPTEVDSDRSTRTVKTLGTGDAFAIPAGRFALVLTEEIVTLPINALGLFSIRSRVKWKGLVNVSGFHIDPGFSGRLTIAVYNAGPTPIHLRRGDPVFLVWFADLDALASAKDAKDTKGLRNQISTDVLNQAPGEGESLQGLSAKISAVEQNQTRLMVTASTLLALLGSVLIAYLISSLKPAAPPAPPAVSASQPTPPLPPTPLPPAKQ